ncbi:probable RNA-binding protein 46 isoform X2 [Ischnura elegans]|uniref:probable RNA-binding protein 46 isoform X2 n=1 Tax=Ischnura elegans TaxID=197161 RepID=UPI001ED87710|nr:probable RNA-binding protein 46 isoform X2 [Ischnura elegans]
MALCQWEESSQEKMEKEENNNLLLQMKKMEMSTRRLIDLSERTNYRIIQVNGQRTYGPPPSWFGDSPGKDCEVFVGRIPRDCFEDELIPVLELAGFIYEFRLMMDFSGSNRGFGFALYSKPSEARQAIEKLNHYEIRPGCTLGIVKSMNNCKLFIGGLDIDVTEEEITVTLNCMTPGVSRVTLHPSRSSNPFQRPKKYALVEYETHRAAAMARRVLVPQKMRFRGIRVVVDWANPFGEDQKWEKKSYQGTSSKAREKRNSVDSKSKVDGRSKFNDSNCLPPAQTRLGAGTDTSSLCFRDGSLKEMNCDNFLELQQNGHIMPFTPANSSHNVFSKSCLLPVRPKCLDTINRFLRYLTLLWQKSLW